MFEFASPLFWYRLVFLTELVISEGLFTFKLKKRPYFALRTVIAVLACYAVAFCFPIFAYNSLYVSFMFLFYFLMTVVALHLLYAVPLRNVIFCAVAAYAVQHTAYELYTLITTALNMNIGDIQYSESGSMTFSVFATAVYVEGYTAVYGIMYAIFGTKIKFGDDLQIGRISLLVISSFIVVVAILFNAILTYRINEDSDPVIVCMLYGCIMISCILAVFIQFFMLNRKELQQEIDTLHRLHEQEMRHYMLFKENVDYINVKCHDLKHQISCLAGGGKLKDTVISEIENSIKIYDSDVKTGNDVLDIIMTEKSLLCVRNKIKFSFIVDGKSLDFISDVDICALFGNALDNAIEAVCRIENTENRSIGLHVKTVRDFVSVCVRNSCVGDVVFEGGLPKTSKGDEVNHGYGMKSMKSVVESYGGELSVVAENGIFNLNMLFPGRGTRNDGEAAAPQIPCAEV